MRSKKKVLSSQSTYAIGSISQSRDKVKTPQTACMLRCTHRVTRPSSQLVQPPQVPLRAFPFPPPLTISAHGRHHVRVVRVPEGRVYRGGRGKHVSSVAERQVAHGHVSGQRSAERRALVVHAFGEFLEAVAAPLILFRFVGHFTIACLYSLLFHGQRSVHLRDEREETS